MNLSRITLRHVVHAILTKLKQKETWDKASLYYFYFYSPCLQDILLKNRQDDPTAIDWLVNTQQERQQEVDLSQVEKILAEDLNKTFISVYCDGGFRAQGQAAWAFYIQNTNELHSNIVRYTKTSHETELFAIKQVFSWLKTQSKNKYYFIFSDSLSLVDKINNALSLLKKLDLYKIACLYESENGFLSLLEQMQEYHFELNWVSNQHEILSVVDTQCDLLLAGKKKKKKKKKR